MRIGEKIHKRAVTKGENREGCHKKDNERGRGNTCKLFTTGLHTSGLWKSFTEIFSAATFFFKSMKSFVDRDVQRGEGKLHVKVRTSLGTSACYPIMNACKEKMIFVFLKTGCFNFCVWLLCKNIQFDKSSVIWFNCIDPITKS